MPDSDGDGLDDVLEAVLMTNPGAADTDGDGASDGLELARRSDPLVAANLPGPPLDSLRVGFWSRTSSVAGHVRSFSFIYLPDGYPAAGVQMELVLLDEQGDFQFFDETWLSGPQAQRTIDFLPVAGDDEALLMVVGANLPSATIGAQGYMSGATVVWHGADSAPEANERNRDADDGLWLLHPAGGPILFRRPVLVPGASGGDTFFTPIDPTTEPPSDWEAGAICHQGTLPVGYEDGVVITRVINADCEDGWDSHCSPSECAASEGDEYRTIDPVGLVGG